MGNGQSGAGKNVAIIRIDMKNQHTPQAKRQQPGLQSFYPFAQRQQKRAKAEYQQKKADRRPRQSAGAISSLLGPVDGAPSSG
jgi:hypothetical protein